MESLGEQIHSFIDDAAAIRLLTKYHGGAYTGSRFDTATQLKSLDRDRFTAHDFAAVAVLSVPLSGRAIVGLMQREAELAALLESVPDDVDLVSASDAVLEAVFAVQRVLDELTDVGHVTRSKLLAHKRPELVPIRDKHVLAALIGRDHGAFTKPLRDVLKADGPITERLEAVQDQADLQEPISNIRALDVIVWMSTHGDSQVSD